MDSATPNKLSLLPPAVASHFPPDTPFVRLGVWGNGSCFFNSLCAAQNHRGYITATPDQQKRIGAEYRCNFSKKITDERWEEFSKRTNVIDMTAEQARRNFCNSKTWANQPMITFVSEVLGMNILFIDATISKLYCGVHGGSDDPLVVVLWVERAHFEPVGACRAIRDNETSVQFIFDPINDANIVNHITNAYQAQCEA